MTVTLIEQVASDTVIDAAYEWLCERRHDYHHNIDGFVGGVDVGLRLAVEPMANRCGRENA